MLLGVLMLGAIVRPSLPFGRALRVPGVAASPAAVGAAAAPLLLRRGKRSRVPARVRAVATADAEAPTLDERLVSESPDVVTRSLTMRRAPAEQLAAVERIGELTRRRAERVEAGNDARAERKALSPKIGALMKAGDTAAADALKEEVAKAAALADASDAEVATLEEERAALFSALPNLLDPRVHDGDDEEANEVVSSWGFESESELRTGLRWHDEVGTGLGGLDLEAASKLSGSRFSVLRGSLARLERALINFFLDTHTAQHGYTEAMVPYLVRQDALEGTGQLPKFEEDLFKLAAPLNGKPGYLIPTAEVPLTNLHAGEILDEASLPLSYAAFTPCFRAEAGSHGKDTRGLFRQHQFHKVELVKVCTPEQSDAEHHALVGHAEACLQLLGLPYRKVKLCSGDIGFSARLCYDLEVWLPGQGRFREISSCSNCADFQARRMGLRYRPKALDAKGKPQKPVFCHTINGSGLAVGRALVALLETYQNDDGSLTIPEALRPYMGGLEKIEPQ